MPRNKNNTKPPKAMTWLKASPALIVACVFYLLQQIFELFIFFGPALLAVGCTVGANSVTGATLSGAVGKATAVGCTGVAALAGFFGVEGFEGFGLVMAMAVGFMGWLTVGFIILTTNLRLFKSNVSNAPWYIFSLLITEIPFIELIPALPITVFRMYHAQIKKERAALKAWEKERAAEQLQERQEQAVYYAQMQNAQVAQLQEREAANEASYAEAANENELSKEAANDDEYIPQDQKRAA